MMCNIISYVVALIVPFSEPAVIVKKECWTQIENTKTSIVYEVQEITEVIPLNVSYSDFVINK